MASGAKAVEQSVYWIMAFHAKDLRAVPFLDLLGIVAGDWQIARAVIASAKHLAAGEGKAAFHKAKIVTVRFFADH